LESKLEATVAETPRRGITGITWFFCSSVTCM